MAGMNYFFSKNVAFEGGLYYQRKTFNETSGPYNDRSSNIGLRLGLQIFFWQKINYAKGLLEIERFGIMPDARNF